MRKLGVVWSVAAFLGLTAAHVICADDSTATPDAAAAMARSDAAWPQFRGPDGQGHVLQGALPLRWSEKKNVVWKTPLPGEGWSSPVIQGNQIWMTTATDASKSLRALCVDLDTGRLVHNVEVFRVDDPGTVHKKNGHASPTPVIAGERVFVHFGAHGTACLSTAGEIVWKTSLAYYHHHGPGASPALAGDWLFLACDGYTGPGYDKISRNIAAPQFVAALDPANGEVVWRKDRAGQHAYATPLVIEVDGRTQVVSPGGDRVVAYDASTGDEIWWCRYTGYSLVPRPVYGHGLVYVCTGYDPPTSLLALRPDGAGDVTDTHLAWKITSQAVPLTPSPILVGNELYFVSDSGVLSCMDAKAGKVKYRQRLGGNFSASPIVAGNRLYFQSESGQMHVIEAGAKFEKLAVNTIEGPAFASPATANGALYLRGGGALYRIEEAAEK